MSVIAQPHGIFEFRPNRLLSRMHARLRADSLDRALVAGVSPEASVLLAVHAQRIARPRTCRTLATTLRRLNSDRTGPGAIPVRRSRIRLAAPRLDAIATRLETNGPIPARGMAALRLLLSDGAGPLYRTGTDTNLDGQLARILADLELG